MNMCLAADEQRGCGDAAGDVALGVKGLRAELHSSALLSERLSEDDLEADVS